MLYTIQEHDAVLVGGLPLRTNNAFELQGGKIASAWSHFLQKELFSAITNKVRSDEICAAYFDYESDHTGEYSFLLGANLSRPSIDVEGMECRSFPAATYAVFSVPTFADVLNTWKQIWSTDLNRTYKADFEFYRGSLAAPTIEIYIGIR